MFQQLDPSQTTWHITFGMYATRLHGDLRLTVDRKHNQINQDFVKLDIPRVNIERDLLKANPILLTGPQRAVVESIMPAICDRGRWQHRIAAAPVDGDHVHVLLDAKYSIEPDAILKWLKRWLGEELSQRWGKPVTSWWAECGSTKPVKDEQYLNNVYQYIRRQRTLPMAGGG